jgi:hypothetical protein
MFRNVLNSSWIGPSAGSCGHGYEPSASINDGDFLNWPIILNTSDYVDDSE